jgi:HlyD family type I secretion membrane fusion protein
MRDNVRDLVPGRGEPLPVNPSPAISPPSLPAAPGPIPPDDSHKKYAIWGWAILILFFGGFGGWAMTAPLNGAVVSNAVVKVQGNRKSVQHLDGGIVKGLNVKEGDHVKQGDVLIVLDDSQARAEFEVLSKQQVVLTATVTRLTAELNHAALAAPQELSSRLSEPEVQAVWTAQTQQFNSRRTALEGQRKVIGEKINQLKEQIVGNERQVTAFNEQIASVKKELESITPLVDKGLIAQPRKLQLERTAFGLQGQIAETSADIARAKQAIAEQSQQIAQLDNDRSADVTKELRDTQALLLEVTPKLTNAKAVLSRMDIRSPYTGQVVGLNVFAVGAVIQRGEKILDIVPDEDDLTVEAQIAVEDISEIHPGMLAEVHLTSYKQRITPMVHGDLIQVSADRLTDNRTGQPYYTALVRIHQDELNELPNVHLYPGMPARVMIPTVERTAFDYLVGPLVMSFNSAFRQK